MSDWRDEAACLEYDPELWWPIGSTGPAVQQIDAAKEICGGCPVIETCLAWALDTGQDFGVWGGLSEDERRSLKRRRARLGRAEQLTGRTPQSPRREYLPIEDSRALILAAMEKGWTAGRIGASCEVSWDTIRNIANGTSRSVSPATAAKIAAAAEWLDRPPVGQAVSA